MTLDSYTPVSGDFNGDARTDFGLHDDNWGAEDVYFANSSGIFGSAQTGWVNYSIGDLNGDRRADYVLWGDTYLSTGTTHPLAEDGAFPFVWGYDILADFNGDGLDDVLHWGDDDDEEVNVYLSMGDGRMTASVHSYDSWYWPAIGDWNGDGRADIAYSDNAVNGGDLTFYISTGDIDPNTSRPFFEEFTSLSDWNSNQVLMGDFNGDGVGDMWRQAGGGATTAYTTDPDNSTSAVVYNSDVITSVTNGLGVVSEVQYRPMTDDDVYARGAAAAPAYPITTIQAARLLVERIVHDDGDGGTRASTFDYTQARTDLDRRAGLLFGERRVKDERSGIVETTTFRQDFPFVGMPVEVARVRTSAVAVAIR
jgi:hypothetical protein